jgi:hypothetical protein
MKLQSSKFFTTLVLLLALSCNQLFSIIILRKDDPALGGASNSLPNQRSFKAKATADASGIPVLADLNDSNLKVSFTLPVGVAVITIEDKSGNVVYATNVNTSEAIETDILVDYLDSGDYVLRVAYGNTRLVGDFSL